ncbi:MAG: tetratricopeptide repeat protein [Gemmatimonadota bacterium]|nr:tetratricopeptide repeat protein [Gemmatimonadota bacterium]
MTKEDIIKTTAEDSSQPKTKIAATLNLLIFEVSNAMVRRERVEIRRFGAFEVKRRKARVARDLNTDEKIQLPPRGMPRFVPFTALKNKISAAFANEGGVEARPTAGAPPLKQVPTVATPTPQMVLFDVQSSNRKPAQEIQEFSAPDPETSSKDELAMLWKAVEDDPGNADKRLALAEAYLTRGDFVGALDQTESVLQKHVNHMHAINLQGIAHEQQGIDECAMHDFERALQVDADDAETLLNIGCLRSKLGQYNEAELNYKHVLELNPQQVDASFNLGIIHNRRGLYGRAIKEFERVIDLDPGNTEAYFHLGKTYDHLERYDDAINMFEELLKMQPDNDQAFWHLGMLHDKKQDGAKALEMYQHSNSLLSAAKKERY